MSPKKFGETLSHSKINEGNSVLILRLSLAYGAGPKVSDTRVLNDFILKALKDRKACLIGNHGQIAFEENLPKAFELAEEVENISLQYITSLKLGKPKILSKKEMKKVLLKAKNYKKG